MNRITPWQQLGTDITNAKNVDEAMTMAGLNYTVEKKPIYDANGRVINGFFANTNTSNDSVMGIVKKNYQIVQNIDAFDFTNNLVNEGVDFEKAGSFHHGNAAWLLAKMPEVEILGDATAPFLVFVNSFDGTGAVRVAMVPMRIACSNALNFALKHAVRSWSTKHVGDIYGKLEEAKYTLGLANNYLTALNEEAEKLAIKPMTDNEFAKIFDSIMPINANDSARKIRNVEDIKTAMFDALKAPDLANFNGTAYQKLMAVTDAIDHIEPARMTDTFAENRWQKIAQGHSVVDAFYTAITA